MSSIKRALGAFGKRTRRGSEKVRRSFAHFALALSIALSVFAVTVPASAQDISAALQKFTTDSYSDTNEAIGDLAASGNPRAGVILQALQAGTLEFVEAGALVIRTDAGVVDAATGAPVANPPADLSPVRTNNRVRGTIDAALGSLTLMDPDPAKRIFAADAVFKSRDAAALPALDQALAKETNAAAKVALAAARAAIVLLSPDASDNERVIAADMIRLRGGQESAVLLRSLPDDTPKRVKEAADNGAKAIESTLALMANVQNVWYGLSLGSVLLLAAIGLAITFGVMGVINMAHGEMVMIGAYCTYVVQQLARAYAPSLMDWTLLAAVPLAFLVTGFVGVLIERSIIRFLYGRPLETLLATFGLSLILQQAVRTAFGANNRDVIAPAFMSGSFDFFGLSITSGRMWIIAFAIVVFIVLQLVLRATPFGLRMRAVTQNRRMASAMGIDTNRIDALAFGLGSGIAGMAGVALSQIDNVSPNLGQSYIIDSFHVVVFGGVGNLYGTLVAALTLGVANKLLEPWVGAVLGKIALLVFIILFIQKRPRGLFALKGRAVEA